MTESTNAAEVRRLNDQLRCKWIGGRIILTNGIAALDEPLVSKILAAVASFDAFDKENDPYGEHDCAILTVDNINVLFKIDYYDNSMSQGSEDPSDPSITTRVLTVMRAEEY